MLGGEGSFRDSTGRIRDDMVALLLIGSCGGLDTVATLQSCKTSVAAAAAAEEDLVEVQQEVVAFS